MLTKSADASALLSSYERRSSQGSIRLSGRHQPFAAKIPDHPALSGFWPSEQRAILWYRVELRSSLQRSLSIDETVERWEGEDGPAGSWRRVKVQIDGRMQIVEIERHKYHLSEEFGYDVGWDHAATDWIEKFAAEWREWWEQQPGSLPDLAAEPR